MSFHFQETIPGMLGNAVKSPLANQVVQPVARANHSCVCVHNLEQHRVPIFFYRCKKEENLADTALHASVRKAVLTEASCSSQLLNAQPMHLEIFASPHIHWVLVLFFQNHNT